MKVDCPYNILVNFSWKSTNLDWQKTRKIDEFSTIKKVALQECYDTREISVDYQHNMFTKERLKCLVGIRMKKAVGKDGKSIRRMISHFPKSKRSCCRWPITTVAYLKYFSVYSVNIYISSDFMWDLRIISIS